MAEKQAVALEELTSLVDHGQRQKLRLLLNEQHPADLAEYFAEMDPPHRLSCFRLLDLDNASAVLAELEPENQYALLTSLGDIGVVPIIARMSPDDAADVLSELPLDKATEIIEQISDVETRVDLRQLLQFEDDTAGGIMSTDYLSLFAQMTAGEALVNLRQMYEDLEEDIYDIYVVDGKERLVGRVTVKELLTVDPKAQVESVMDTDLPRVTTSTDQEEAANLVGRYDLLTLPVVDDNGILCGIITADDVIDVLREEATEDIYQSSGISAGEPGEALAYNVGKAFSARLPWLLITLGIETGSVTVITNFDAVIQQTVAAAAFMPLLSGVTGSVATQSTCIIIRGTSSRTQLNTKTMLRYIFHELKVGILLGIFCGIFTYIISLLLHTSRNELGIIVAFSLTLTMTVGVVIGTTMPMFFQKLGIDPAHASGPFITSILDVSTMTIYLTIVHYFLSHLI